MIFPDAVLLPERIIEFSGEGQFTQKVAEGGFIEHGYLPQRHGFSFLQVSMTQWLLYLFYLPIKPWADRALTDLGPLRARRAGNIHVE